MPKHRYFTVDGRRQRLSEWAIESGICSSTLKRRIDKQGMSMEDALAFSGRSKPKMHTLGGKTQNIRAWAAEYNICESALGRRLIENGGDIARAIAVSPEIRSPRCPIHFSSDGYVISSKKAVHRIIAENAIGRPLKGSEVVHHIDKNRANNSRTNLVVCPDAKFHQMIHARERALDACGNPSYRSCVHCKEYDATENMVFRKLSESWMHKECQSEYNREIKMRASA